MSGGNTSDLIDFSQIDTLLSAAGRDGVDAILQAFWRSTDNLANQLDACVDANDLCEASRAAHALKGSAANVGACRLASAAREVEIACRDGDAPAAKSAIVEVRAAYGVARRLLTERVAAAA